MDWLKAWGGGEGRALRGGEEGRALSGGEVVGVVVTLPAGGGV